MDKNTFISQMEQRLATMPTLKSGGIAPPLGVAGHCPDDIINSAAVFDPRRVYVAYLYFRDMTTYYVPIADDDPHPMVLHVSHIQPRIQHLMEHEDSLLQLPLGDITIGEIVLAALIAKRRIAFPEDGGMFPVCLPFIYAKPKQSFAILPKNLWRDVDSSDLGTGRTSLWQVDGECYATDIPRTLLEFCELTGNSPSQCKPLPCGNEWYHFLLDVPEWIRNP
ncbi:MAG: hypothetical protein IE913_00295 [Halothiobacillus sp.]|nr:hypothetical protein [Halothiobacillus sp.]